MIYANLIITWLCINLHMKQYIMCIYKYSAIYEFMQFEILISLIMYNISNNQSFILAEMSYQQRN